VIFAYSSPF